MSSSLLRIYYTFDCCKQCTNSCICGSFRKRRTHHSSFWGRNDLYTRCRSSHPTRIMNTHHCYGYMTCTDGLQRRRKASFSIRCKLRMMSGWALVMGSVFLSKCNQVNKWSFMYKRCSQVSAGYKRRNHHLYSRNQSHICIYSVKVRH